jgi:hypothetical protein
MLRYLLIILISLLAISCSQKKSDTMDKLDKIYGECDNPHRELKKIEYDICKDKEMSKMDNKPINLTDIFNRGGGGSAIMQPTVNPALWRAALKTINQYSIKISDNSGGYIETEWLYKPEEPNKRCLIKIQIVSEELVSTGVASKIVCEQKQNDQWYNDGQEYAEESKQIVLSILQNTQSLN